MQISVLYKSKRSLDPAFEFPRIEFIAWLSKIVTKIFDILQKNERSLGSKVFLMNSIFP